MRSERPPAAIPYSWCRPSTTSSASSRSCTRDGEVVIGATVGTFDQLFAMVARATDAPAGPAVSRTQRLRLARETAARAELGILATSSRRPGFPAALDELVSELQAALVDPVSLRERAAEAGSYELEIATLYESYLALRDELGLHDDHSLAAGRDRRAPTSGPTPGEGAQSSSTASTT